MAPLDLICMGLVLALIAAVGVGGARRHPAREDFFSKEESNAVCVKLGLSIEAAVLFTRGKERFQVWQRRASFSLWLCL
ncbi:hypothetical protein, partial [Collinsella sp. LCP19S3_C9]|uniref:hypothetical protein n=1 Tax=Collinsella sp. LCP19S3_C9 TaxID=3438760 RepID=UPI003F917676